MDSWLIDKQLPYHFISASGLIRKEGHILLIHSLRRGWEMPGGLAEQGESVIETLKREVLEESGIVCEPEHFTGIYQNLMIKDGYGPLEGMKLPPVVNLTFICRYVSGEPTVTEGCDDARWVAPDEAAGMITHPLYKKQLADMLAYSGSIVLDTFRYNNDPMKMMFLSETIL
jgi:8-oxo-dGTP pyrophosphatase MutT (NUDIX family)